MAGADSASSSGQLAVEWAGVNAQTFSAPAEARWCRRDTLLEVVAARSDTGVGLVFTFQDSLRVGQHPVASSAVGANWRPAGLAALRWVNDTAVRGFEANQGSLEITSVGPEGISGTVDVRLKHLDTSDTVRLRGRFDGVPVWPAADSMCGRIRA